MCVPVKRLLGVSTSPYVYGSCEYESLFLLHSLLMQRSAPDPKIGPFLNTVSNNTRQLLYLSNQTHMFACMSFNCSTECDKAEVVNVVAVSEIFRTCTCRSAYFDIVKKQYKLQLRIFNAVHCIYTSYI